MAGLLQSCVVRNDQVMNEKNAAAWLEICDPMQVFYKEI
jgi:hypothetical protein